MRRRKSERARGGVHSRGLFFWVTSLLTFAPVDMADGVFSHLQLHTPRLRRLLSPTANATGTPATGIVIRSNPLPTKTPAPHPKI